MGMEDLQKAKQIVGQLVAEKFSKDPREKERERKAKQRAKKPKIKIAGQGKMKIEKGGQQDDGLQPMERARQALAVFSKAGTAGTEVPPDPATRGASSDDHQVVSAPSDPARGSGIIGHPGVSDQGASAPAKAFGDNEFDKSSAEGTSMDDTSNEAVQSGAEARIKAARERSRSAGAQSDAGLSRDGFKKSESFNPQSAEDILRYLAEHDTDGSFADVMDASDALEHLVDTIVGANDNMSKGLALIFRRQETLRKSHEAFYEEQQRQGELLTALATSMDALLQHGIETEEALGKSFSLQAGAALVRPVTPGIALVGGSGGQGAASGALPAGLTTERYGSGLQKAFEAGKLDRVRYQALSLAIDTQDLGTLWSRTPEDIQALIAS